MLEPARRQGYKQIWIVGASMGGLGSLIVASRLPGAVDRVVLLSPYLGPNSLIRDIEAAGGPARWTPTDLDDPVSAHLAVAEEVRGAGRADAADVLGFARQEGMAPNHRLLAQLLPADRVFEVDGKHGWVAWRELWKQELAAVARGPAAVPQASPDEAEAAALVPTFMASARRHRRRSLRTRMVLRVTRGPRPAS